MHNLQFCHSSRAQELVEKMKHELLIAREDQKNILGKRIPPGTLRMTNCPIRRI
jgi:hypothetical protein